MSVRPNRNMASMRVITLVCHLQVVMGRIVRRNRLVVTVDRVPVTLCVTTLTDRHSGPASV